MQVVEKYFPDLSIQQQKQFQELEPLYRYWNERINVISRKDIDELYLRHVLHSLSIARHISFLKNSRILDVGTGGGFPGIPLAIFFPDVHFHLVDSIGKKIKVVNEIARDLKLENVLAEQIRAEKVKRNFDFVVSRAVTSLPAFIPWVRKKMRPDSRHQLRNGILALKGGSLDNELDVSFPVGITDIGTYFSEPFFETKKIIHVALVR